MDYINPWRMFIGAFIPNWLLDRREVSLGAKLVYARLCQYAGRNGQAWPRQDLLAQEIGLKRRQVIRYLKELREHRLIEVTQIGLGRTNVYRFLAHEWMDDGSQGSVRSDTREVSELTLPLKRINRKRIKEHKVTCICEACLAGRLPPQQ